MLTKWNLLRLRNLPCRYLFYLLFLLGFLGLLAFETGLVDAERIFLCGLAREGVYLLPEKSMIKGAARLLCLAICG